MDMPVASSFIVIMVIQIIYYLITIIIIYVSFILFDGMSAIAYTTM